MNAKCKNVAYKDLLPAAGRWDAEVLGNIFKELGVR